MDWLSEHWIWIALLVAGYFLATRRGTRWRATRRVSGRQHRHARPNVLLARRADTDVANTIDPVSKRPLPDLVDASSIYDGRIFFFESRANRAAFERNPKRYALNARHISRSCRLRATS